MKRSGVEQPSAADNLVPHQGRRHPCCIVAVGASAGGLDACRDLFMRIPSDTGLGFVVIRHLDSEQENLMPDLLARYSTMPVLQIADKTPVMANHVYVIPPNASLAIYGGVLRMKRPREPRGHRAPIDDFFRSLAEDQGDNAVAIVLSGNGADGAMGVRAVKERGGLVIAQSIESAGHGDMPRNAVATGVVDHVLPVEEMPRIIIDHAERLNEHREGFTPETIHDEVAPYLDEICAVLRSRTGHDFSRYKQGTLLRRIGRRMRTVGSGSVVEYVARLHKDAKEAEHLFNDLLIGVTAFFRDPEAFQALDREIIPRLFENKGAGDHIRIWTPGCASGEETYSIAILLRERLASMASTPHVQIFATDIDAHALELARQGSYPSSIAEQISPERLERFFTRHGDDYRIAKEIREMCVFSPHNILKDPPFSRIDLISCRNLMIYLEGDLQKNLVSLFHYALTPGGYLFLGPSESVMPRSEFFRPLDKKHRIFRRKDTLLRPAVNFPIEQPKQFTKYQWEPALRSPFSSEQNVGRITERVLLENYAPASVIINEQSEIVYFSGRTGAYLEPPAGTPSMNVVTMARKGLRMELRTAIHKAISTHQQIVHEDVPVETIAGLQRINLIVRPMTELGDDSGLYMVVFQESTVIGGEEFVAAEGEGAEKDRSTIRRLEQELRTTKEHLQTTIEELETTNEELKSSNEELLSMNEELQSANEELQTTKEELLSVNEELHVVNVELVEKIEEINRVNSDLLNLFESTEIATVFLDNDLRIKKFTPATVELFHLIESDIGRPITDIATRFVDGDMISEIRSVLRKLSPREREIQRTEQGRYYIMRVLPYRTVDNVIDGVVVTFADVTELKGAQEAVARLAAIVESSQDAIIGKTLDGTITSWNRGAERLYGYSEAEMIGRLIRTIAPAARMDEMDAILRRLRRGERVETYETVRMRKDGTNLDVSVTVSPIRGSNGEIIGASSIARDISERKRVEAALRESEERLRVALDAADMGTWRWDLRSDIDMRDASLNRILGLRHEESVQPIEDYVQRIHAADRSVMAEALQHALGADGAYTAEYRIVRPDESIRWLRDRGKVVRDADGRPVYMTGAVVDVTELKLAEERLHRQTGELAESARRTEESLALLDAWLLSSPVGLAFLDRDLRYVLINEAQAAINNVPVEEHIGRCFRDVLPEWAHTMEPMFRAVMESGEPLRDLEISGEAQPGEGRRDVLSNLYPVRLADGRLLGVGCVTLDITDRKRAEEAMIEWKNRYEAAARASGQILYDWNPNTNIITWGGDIERILGHTAQEITGDLSIWIEMLHPDDRAMFKREIERLDRRFVPTQLQFRVRRKDGAYVYVEGRGSFVFDSEGAISHMVGFVVDITDRKRAEEALEISKQRLDLVVTSTELGIWYCDLPFDKLIWNDKCKEHFGLPADAEVTIDLFYELIHPDDRVRTRKSIEHSIRHKSVYDIDYRTIGRDGRLRWIRAIGYAFYDEQGEPKRFDGVTIDVTPQKQSEEALQAAKAELTRYAQELERRVAERTADLQETVKSLESFTYSIAHDLRAPLRAVQGYTSILLEDYAPSFDQVGRDYARRITGAAEHMDNLIQDLLAYGRLSHIDITTVPLALESVVDDVVAQLAEEIAAKKAIITVERPMPVACAHMTALAQALTNLISNAMKFVAPDTEPHVRIYAARRDDGTVRLTVEDNGIGIDAAHRERIFGVFERLHAVKDYPGTGIGLAIVRKGVERMGGRVGVESELGKGSRFWIDLPKGESEPQAKPASPEHSSV